MVIGLLQASTKPIQAGIVMPINMVYSIIKSIKLQNDDLSLEDAKNYADYSGVDLNNTLFIYGLAQNDKYKYLYYEEGAYKNADEGTIAEINEKIETTTAYVFGDFSVIYSPENPRGDSIISNYNGGEGKHWKAIKDIGGGDISFGSDCVRVGDVISNLVFKNTHSTPEAKIYLNKNNTSFVFEETINGEVVKIEQHTLYLCSDHHTEGEKSSGGYCKSCGRNESGELLPSLNFSMYGGNDQYRVYECSIYTDDNKEINYTKNTDNWNVEFVQYKGMQLNLNNLSVDASLHILKDSYINVTGNNTINSYSEIGLDVSKNIEFIGDGSLTINSDSKALIVNDKIVINGPTINVVSDEIPTINTNGSILLQSGAMKINSKTYDKDTSTLYLVKKASKDYSLYADENYQIEYAIDRNTKWDVVESSVGNQKYVSLRLYDDFDKNIIFKQDNNENYIIVLEVDDDATLGGLNADENVITIQAANNNTLTVNGDIKASSIYLSECDNLTMNLVNSSLKATNNITIDSSTVNIKKGSILVENGLLSLVKATVNIKKNDLNEAADLGINAHSIFVDNAILNIKDVSTGINMYNPERLDDDGATLSLTNGSSIDIETKDIGIQGTYGLGGYYYNNILVEDSSAITVIGENKAIACASISRIPSGKMIFSTDDKKVYFKINDDANFTTDYYYADTNNVVTGLTVTYNQPMLIQSDDNDFKVVNNSAKGYREFNKGNTVESTIHIADLDLSNVYRDDETTYSGIVVVNGDNKLTEGVDYIVTNGSIKINLKKSYLDKLSVGTHAIDVYVGTTRIPNSSDYDYTFEVIIKINEIKDNDNIPYKVVNTGING